MSEIPYPGTDPTILKINRLLEDVATGVAVRMVEAAVIAAAPWMGAPVWRQVWQFGFEWAVSKAYDGGFKLISVNITDMQVNEQKEATKAAEAELVKEITTPTEGQHDARIDQILADYDANLERLIAYPRAS